MNARRPTPSPLLLRLLLLAPTALGPAGGGVRRWSYASEADALIVARSIATSALVKTAFFGADANWGRIIAAAGYAGMEGERHCAL